MTNYNAWDAKAKALTEEAEAESKQEEAVANKALGLEDGPQGPPVAKSAEQLRGLGEHSQQRKEFIEWSSSREMTLTHTAAEHGDRVELTSETVKGKGVRLESSSGLTYHIPADAGMAKLILERCQGIRVVLEGSLVTSTIEVCRCEHLELELDHPLGTLQVDECEKPVTVKFSELEHIGAICHQNSPGLRVVWNGMPDSASDGFIAVGVAGPVQLCTRSDSGSLSTEPVRRGENEYPINLQTNDPPRQDPTSQPEPEEAPLPEQRQQMAHQKRLEGNEMFRANDFMQATFHYSQALDLDPSVAAVWANRSQCWLRLGDHAKALSDANECIALDPSNAKGWFRKGMSLHAQKEYAQAIPALAEAEKLDPKNKQISEAIKYAQLMARKQAQTSS